MIYFDELNTDLKYKMVRRGQRYCVRVKGMLNTTKTWHWCRERNLTYSIKQHWTGPNRLYQYWDYDFIFDKKSDALMFIMGYP